MVNATAYEPDFPHLYSYTEICSILADPRKHIVIGTSGSTGSSKQVLIPSSALAYSSLVASEVLGRGKWLLTLPTNHIAGVNVLARAALSGLPPAIIPPTQRFSQEAFIAASSVMGTGPRFVSLVPTQLHRILDNTPLYDESLAALASYAAVLVGGAATAPQLHDQARAAGINLVTSYGMSETCGGCVYDGYATGDTRIRVDDDQRIWLSGSSLASGYLAEELHSHNPLCQDDHKLAETSSFVPDSDRFVWHRTNDLGALSPASAVEERQSLTVIGRADDTILTGGLNVVPARIDAALSGNHEVKEALTIGVPDPEWGSRVVTLVTKRTGSSSDLGGLRRSLTDSLGKGYAPQAIYVVDQLPLTSSGKPDRRKAVEIAIAIETAQSKIGHSPQ